MAQRSVIEELKRRNVFRVAFAYLAGSWLLIQIADIVMPRFGFSDESVTTLIIFLGIGFVPVLVLAWVFQRTAAGFRLDRQDSAAEAPVSHKRFDQAVIALLVLAVGFFAVDKFILDPARDAALVEQAREEGRANAVVESYGDKSIAVLPFVNLSSDPEQEYFSDGIAEELLNLLAQIPELRVISRSTAFTFKGVDIVIPEVARKLNVAHILEGSVRKSGNRIRITAQLIDGNTDTHLWSQTYDRETGDIFAIQDEISAKVVAELKLKLLGEAPTSDDIDPLAYDLYLRGRHLLHLNESRQFDLEALGYLEKALELEPDWVPLLSEMIRAVFRLAGTSPDEKQIYREMGWGLLARLEQADKKGARALGWRGWFTLYWLDDVQLAARYLEQASDIEPLNLDLLRGLSVFFTQLHRYDEAVAVAEYLVINDPACSSCINNLAFGLRQLGRFREAAERLEGILEWREPTQNSYWTIGVSWLAAQEPERALVYFDKLVEKDPKDNLGRVLALHDLGRLEEFEREFAALRSDSTSTPEGIARIYAWIGDRDEAFRWLDIMIEEYGKEWARMVNTDMYVKIKDDPRWAEFLERNGVSEEQLENIEFDPTLPPEIQHKIAMAAES